MVQAAVSRRGIKYVWHFTRVENLASILSNGLIPREKLQNQSNTIFNDQYRFDGERGASCLSIGHPNYKMFYSLRQQFPSQQWVVLAFKPNILWLKDCAFCHENAASNNVTMIPITERKGVAAFEKLFFPIVGKPPRSELQLPDSCPTNPQAEVLVFDLIEPEYIVGIVCSSEQIKAELTLLYPSVDFRYHKSLFSARKDYEHWR